MGEFAKGGFTNVGFTWNMPMVSPRDRFGEELLRIGKEHKNVVVLSADLTRSMKTGQFLEAIPERYINAGIAEADMMGMAAGLALEGFMPFASTFAQFAAMRDCEQVRTDICYPNLPVRIVATHAGLSTGCGPTHYSQEDFAIMRSMINMTVICPGDPNQVEKVLRASLTHPGPIYIRLGREAMQTIYEKDYDFVIGKALVPHEGKDAAIIATGIGVSMAYEAAVTLEKEGMDIKVLDMHTIKPIDKDAIIDAANTGAIVTVEDHNISGGLGSSVAEVLGEAGMRIKFKKLGIPDVWGMNGSPDDLYALYGFDANGIKSAVRGLLN